MTDLIDDVENRLSAFHIEREVSRVNMKVGTFLSSMDEIRFGE